MTWLAEIVSALLDPTDLLRGEKAQTRRVRTHIDAEGRVVSQEMIETLRPRAASAADAAGRFSYGEVGATAGELPGGYRHVLHRAVLGQGRDLFLAASDRLMTWEMHRGAGLVVDASAPAAAPGVVVVLGMGVGRVRLSAPCRVVDVVDEPCRRGFAYGTLVGHPERGEERFVVEHRADGTVMLHVSAFSRPATWWASLGGPVTRAVQDVVTRRYASALLPGS